MQPVSLMHAEKIGYEARALDQKLTGLSAVNLKWHS